MSSESAVVVKTLSKTIAEDGGVALIADYGHDGEKGDTFRVNIGFDPFTTIHNNCQMMSIDSLYIANNMDPDQTNPLGESN